MLRSHLIAFVILGVAAVAVAQEKVTIKAKYLPGTYVVTTKSDTTQEMNLGMAIEQKMTMVMVLEMVVEKPAAQSQKIQITYKRITQDVKGGVMAMSFDSDQNDPASPMNLLRGLVDAPVSVTLDAKGEVAKVEGMDKIWDKMAKDDPAMASMLGDSKKQFGEGMFKQMFSQSRRIFPTGPVAVSDTWKTMSSEELPLVGEIKVTQSNTLEKIEKAGGAQIAVIGFKGEGSSAKPGAVAMDKMKMTMKKMDETLSGTAKINIQTGVVEESVVDQETAMEMAVAGPDGSDLSITMKEKGKIVTTMKEGKYVAPPKTKPAAAKAAAAEATE